MAQGTSTAVGVRLDDDSWYATSPFCPFSLIYWYIPENLIFPISHACVTFLTAFHIRVLLNVHNYRHRFPTL